MTLQLPVSGQPKSRFILLSEKPFEPHVRYFVLLEPERRVGRDRSGPVIIHDDLQYNVATLA